MAVITTASKESLILELSGDELQIARIPEDATLRVEYHNNLMTLCGLSLRELVDAMKQAVEKQSRLLPSRRERTQVNESPHTRPDSPDKKTDLCPVFSH